LFETEIDALQARLLRLSSYDLRALYKYSVDQKGGPHAHDHNSVKSQQIWKKIYWNIYLVKWILKIPPHFAYVATLLCETLVSAINDKLQGNVATYLRCGCIVNNQIRKSLLLSLSVKFFQIGEYLAKLQART